MKTRNFLRNTVATFAGAALVLAAAGSVVMAHPGHGPSTPAADVPLRANPTPTPAIDDFKNPQADEPTHLPPNCEWVAEQGSSVLAVECSLPPECEVVVVEGDMISATWIECDIADGCTLENGQWGGQTYWFIHCDESECIGGCNPIVPIDPVFQARTTPPPPTVVDDFRANPTPTPTTPIVVVDDFVANPGPEPTPPIVVVDDFVANPTPTPSPVRFEANP